MAVARMDRTRTAVLRAAAAGAAEPLEDAQMFQDLLHRDLLADGREVDPGGSRRVGFDGRRLVRPLALFYAVSRMRCGDLLIFGALLFEARSVFLRGGRDDVRLLLRRGGRGGCVAFCLRSVGVVGRRRIPGVMVSRYATR